MGEPANDTPLRAHDDLLAVFHEAEKPVEAHRVGAEMEKFGVVEGARPIGYEGERGVLALLEHLAERHGWAPEREVDGGPIIALARGSAHVTLEPGSQLELSGAPFSDVHQVAAELDQHLEELACPSKSRGIRWLGLGFQPVAKRLDYEFVPKQRYGIMREYLPTRGGHALDMMLRTATVQANYDYASEADAMKKLRVALKLAPLTTALFANSPFVEGKPFGGKTFRGRVWTDVDPDRSGLLPAMWSERATYATYVEWALDAPMFLFKRAGVPVLNTGQTFRAFFEDGFDGHRPTQGDWVTHLGTLFPEVRLKRTLEVRGADSQGRALASALPALFLGLLYDARALDDADALTASFTPAEIEALRVPVAERGLEAEFRGAPLARLAERVLDLASAGLARRAVLRADGADERAYLAPLVRLVERARSPADDVLDATGRGADPIDALVAYAEL